MASLQCGLVGVATALSSARVRPFQVFSPLFFVGLGLAQEYFWQLVQQPDTHHIAEGYFGLACVDAICSRYDRALAYLELAIAHAPEFKNRARLDKDLRILRGNQIFKQLIEWDGGSIIRDQQRETEFCSDGDQKNSESVS